jgi:UDP-2,3-diacylglucosamine hydrolase
MCASTVPPSTVRDPASSFAVLQAPAHWQRIDFIADLHLQASETATFIAWRNYMLGTRADAIFILGDLFEAWVGDDILIDEGQNGSDSDPDQGTGFAVRCAEVLQAVSQRLTVYFMPGNRDFLLGPAYALASGMTLLDDPTVLAFAGQRWLLSHGDALCLADTDYMQFRAQVRSAPWRNEFLARPLIERQLVGRELRAQSEARKSEKHSDGVVLIDLDKDAIQDWLGAADASTLIHGHTHKPAEHALGNHQRRFVLSDWDGDASPVRASVLRLNAIRPHETGDGARVERLPASAA